MKKYFTKYFPVEGEKIAIGEKYINLVFKLSSYSGKEPFSTVNGHLVETRKKNQDNDDAFNGSKYSMKVRVKLFLCSRDNDEIIGLITAPWVKEGMEFSEEDIHECFVHGKGNPMVRKVQIKCPTCKRFH